MLLHVLMCIYSKVCVSEYITIGEYKMEQDSSYQLEVHTVK